MSKGTIKKVAGQLVIAEGMRDANMFDVVRVSGQRLIGEIIEIHGDEASIQVYEETSGLGPGEPVESTGVPMSVELGPGLISNIYDGIQRPLEEIRAKIGNSLARGVEVPSLDREKKWHFTPVVRQGDAIVAGDVIGTVQETEIVLHRIMAPVGVVGTIKSIEEGDYNITETVAVIETANGTEQPLTLMQRWPVRRGRPYKENSPPTCRWSPASASSTPSSPSPRAVWPPSPVRSVRARRSSSTSWRNGPRRTSSSTSAAASAATR